MADQAINALPTKSSPSTGDKVLMIGTAEEYQMLLDDLATAVLDKLTSKSYTLDQGTKTLIAALNELNSNSRSIFRGNITDLDNAPYSHILECGSNPTGMPSQMGNSCMVFQFNPQANYSAQLAFSFGADKIAIRRKNGEDSWTDWKYFTAN